LALVRIICVSLAVVLGLIGLAWLAAGVVGVVAGRGIGGWNDAWLLLGTPFLLIVFAVAAFVLRYEVFAPRSVLSRAEERAAAPVAVYTIFGGVIALGVGSALVLVWDVPHWIGLPVGLVCFITGAMVGTLRMKPARVEPGRCLECGYDLHGSPGPRCPECGTPFDPQSIRTADDQNDTTERR
jgi:hypothetical protein